MSRLTGVLNTQMVFGLKFPTFIIETDNYGEKAIPLKGFISSCCGYHLLSDYNPAVHDICGYCKKEMNDDTVIPIYGQENMDKVNDRIKILDTFKPNPNTNG